jgi:hypothetical protein
MRMSELDQLYWHSEVPIAEVAARCGHPPAHLHRHVTPLPSGVACYRCASPLAFTSRSQRDGGRLRCRCGCTRSSPVDRRQRDGPMPVVVGGVVLAVRTDRDPGPGIELSADALAAAGIAWSGGLVLVDGTATDVVRAVSSLRPDVLAVRSLCDLGATQTERLQVLFTLTRMRWRVLAAVDLHVDRHGPIVAGDLDDLDDEAPYPGERGFASRLVDATARFGAGRWRW